MLNRWLAGVVLGFASIAAVGCGGAQHHLSAIDIEPVASSDPAFMRLFDDEGNLITEWVGAEHGLIGWTVEPELLISSVPAAYGWLLVAFDPRRDEFYEIAKRSSGWFSTSDQPEELLLNASDGAVTIPLPGPLAAAWDTAGYPTNAGAFQVADGGVRYGERLLLADRGLTHAVLASPSGKWVAAIEQMPPSGNAIFSTHRRTRDVEFVRMVNASEIPLPHAPRSPYSPDGRWTVLGGTSQTVLHDAEGRARILPFRGGDGAIWSPDSSGFLANGKIVSVEDGAYGDFGVGIVLSWERDRIFWWAWRVADHE